MLVTAQILKKQKGLDDSLLAEESRIIAMQDVCLLDTGKAYIVTKA